MFVSVAGIILTNSEAKLTSQQPYWTLWVKLPLLETTLVVLSHGWSLTHTSTTLLELPRVLDHLNGTNNAEWAKEMTFVFLHPAPWPFQPLSIPRQETNSKHVPPPAAFNGPHPGPMPEIWGPNRAYDSPLSIRSLLGQSHLRHHLHYKKGQVSHRIQFLTGAPWQPFQVSTPFTCSLWSSFYTRTRHTTWKEGLLEEWAVLKGQALFIMYPSSWGTQLWALKYKLAPEELLRECMFASILFAFYIVDIQ